MLTYRLLAGGSKQRWRSNHQAADDKSKAQTRRSRSDWQQDSCPGPSAGAKWVFAAAGHERLSPDEAAEMTLDSVGVDLSKVLGKDSGRIARGTRQDAAEAWLIWAEPRPDGRSERAVVASESKHARGCFSAFLRVLFRADWRGRHVVAFPTSGSLCPAKINLGARFLRSRS